MKLLIKGKTPTVVVNYERFYQKVNKTTDCWIWVGARDPQGYGRFGTREEGIFKSRLAHRIAWFLEYGDYPKLHACHSCDNPSCVRPSHLFEGSDADNMRDMRNKGRGFDIPPAYGENNHNKVLTEKDVRSLRALYQSGVSTTKLHLVYSQVSYTTIKNIVARRVWKHI